MVSIRHFTDSDVDTIRTNQYPDVSENEIRSMIHDWNSGSQNGRFLKCSQLFTTEKPSEPFPCMNTAKALYPLALKYTPLSDVKVSHTRRTCCCLTGQSSLDTRSFRIKLGLIMSPVSGSTKSSVLSQTVMSTKTKRIVRFTCS